MKKQEQQPTSADRAQAKINTITRVISKVSCSQEAVERWDRRRQRLHEAVKILTKGPKNG